MEISRRKFIVSSLSASALSLMPFRFALSLPGSGPDLTMDAPLDARPLQRIPGGVLSSAEFNGDNLKRSHSVLWDLQNVIKSRGGIPQPSEEAPVVIVGGGMAGLVAAYELRNLRPILLEQDRFFGGNSKGEYTATTAGASGYSIGAAYLGLPEPGSPDDRLLRELGVLAYGRGEPGDSTTVFFKDRFSKGFWNASTDPAAQVDFARVHQGLKAFWANYGAGGLTATNRMPFDRISFAQWLASTFGQVHPHVLEYFQLYAWSSFTASIEELSASQMLEFIAAETGTIVALPGGNAAITDALYTRLASSIGRDRLRNGSIAVDVRLQGNFVHVTYLDPAGRLKTIRAKACVFAAPKFVAKRVLPDLPTAQQRAMSSIRYRGYVVANVILDRRIDSPCFDLYCLKGEVPPAPSPGHQSERAFTDICFATWAQREQVNQSVLTLYKAFAFDGDRQFLFNPATHDRMRAQMLQSVEPVLHALGVSGANVRGVRMTRWGHSLPVAETNLIASGTAALAHQPIGGKIFFANQDNWGSPCFENSAREARLAAQAVLRTVS